MNSEMTPEWKKMVDCAHQIGDSNAPCIDQHDRDLSIVVIALEVELAHIRSQIQPQHFPMLPGWSQS